MKIRLNKRQVVLGPLQFTLFLLVLLFSIFVPILSECFLKFSREIHFLCLPVSSLDKYAQNCVIASIVITIISIIFTCISLFMDGDKTAQNQQNLNKVERKKKTAAIVVSLVIGFLLPILIICLLAAYYNFNFDVNFGSEAFLTCVFMFVYLAYIIADVLGQAIEKDKNRKSNYRIPLWCVDIPGLVVTGLLFWHARIFNAGPVFIVGTSTAILISTTFVFAAIQTVILPIQEPNSITQTPQIQDIRA